MTEDIILSRISIARPRLSDGSLEETPTTSYVNRDERNWRLSYLKSQFESLELHGLFETYTKKINHGYFSLFLIVQAILSLVHLLVVTIGNTDFQEHSTNVLQDLILYFSLFFLSLIGLLLVDRVAEEYNSILCMSLFGFVLLFFTNFFIPIYHRNFIVKIRPAYTSHLIICCYALFGFQRLLIAATLAIVVSITDIFILCFVTYKGVHQFFVETVFSDSIYLLFIHILGIYFRYMNEIIVRKSFLDRRSFIWSKHQLKREREQTDTLMKSIIPPYVMNKVKKKYIEATAYYRKYKKHMMRNPFDNSLLDEHENVSILFADIVHYTEMTMKLNVTDLIETLNDLFTLFDDTSMKLNVTRIKFLGDCYYCVAGLPPDPVKNHAEACVDLGLAMISIIANVRRKRNLPVNMRIGVHTGKIISGIIGSVKYQFDIWSKAVDIANKMESEGEPGKVHVTNKTKELLHKSYNISPTNKGTEVPQFRQHNLQTYLIAPETAEEQDTNNNQARISIFKKQKSAPNGILLNHLQRPLSIREDNNEDKECNGVRVENERVSTSSSYRRRFTNNNNRTSKSDDRRSIVEAKRRTAFMNNNVKRYDEQQKEVNSEMESSVKNISFSKARQYSSNTKDISIFMLYRNLKDEIEYITLPDPLFKYYLLASLFLIVCIYLVQNLTIAYWELKMTTIWPYIATVGFICLVFLPLSFSQAVWNKYLARFAEKPPSSKCIKCVRLISEFITLNFSVRFAIYLLLYALFAVGFLSEAADCADDIARAVDEDVTFRFRPEIDEFRRCVIPWQMTHTCIMIVMMNFLFLRMPLWVKIFLASLVIGIQSYGVFMFSDEFYGNSETFNHSLQPHASHILGIFFMTFTLHTLDRQTDYMNRLNHLLNQKAKSEQEEANELQFANENLLLNILPSHVASIYLDLDVSRREEELYYEEHHDTAIMFASIITDDLQDILDDKHFLNLMNEYITSFDMLINREQYRNIEKIKIAKWTYMAACGLYPTLREDELERHVTRTSLDVLLNFASDMYKKLDEINKSHYQECKLRIGICHGDIVAGVVGSKKPLYDIWGDPVNMASRMDSTGVPNRIQVMEETAEILKRLGYSCEYRSEIYVKGRDDLVRTYFVELDEDYNLVKTTPS